MDLGIVLSGFTKNIDHLARRILEILFPFRDSYHSLVASLSTFKLTFWYKDIRGEKFRIREQISEMTLHF